MQSQKKRRRLLPQPATVISVIALVTALSGSAYAAFGNGLSFRRHHPHLAKNSVGPRQLKSKAVRTGKIANNSITGKKVAAHTLTGADINVSRLGTVPRATAATSAQDAYTVNGHAAVCPAGATLIRGTCYDLSLNPAVTGVKTAADSCAAKGGYLPTPMQLYSVRNVINLGTGVAPDYSFTDQYYANTSGVKYRTMVIDGSGKVEEVPIDTTAKFVCAYDLVR